MIISKINVYNEQKKSISEKLMDDDIQEKICGKSIKSRRPFNTKRWNEHVKSKAHSGKSISFTNQSKINELFLPTSSKKVSTKLPFVPKVSPGIHPGHEYLNLMKIFGKYDDLNVNFMCELDGEKVRSIHKQCTGKYQKKLCKTHTKNSCEKCADVHRKRVFYK